MIACARLLPSARWRASSTSAIASETGVCPNERGDRVRGRSVRENDRVSRELRVVEVSLRGGFEQSELARGAVNDPLEPVHLREAGVVAGLLERRDHRRRLRHDVLGPLRLAGMPSQQKLSDRRVCSKTRVSDLARSLFHLVEPRPRALELPDVLESLAQDDE